MQQGDPTNLEDQMKQAVKNFVTSKSAKIFDSIRAILKRIGKKHFLSNFKNPGFSEKTWFLIGELMFYILRSYNFFYLSKQIFL